MADILRILDTSMETPALFGWFHLLWLFITAAVTFLFCRFGKGKERQVILVTTFVVIALEIYKQINYTFSYEGAITFDYQWYAFPWQFCSTPLYIGLLAGIIRKGRVHNALCAYLATYSVFAGLAVMIYPGDVFIETVGINIQTIICHGSMVVIGGYLLGSGHVKLEMKTVLKAMPVFAICVALAAVMNEMAHAAGLLENHNFNMFYISPYLECTLPVYSLVHNAVPFPVNLIIYVLGFTAAACVILLLAKGIAALASKVKVGKKNPALV